MLGRSAPALSRPLRLALPSCSQTQATVVVTVASLHGIGRARSLPRNRCVRHTWQQRQSRCPARSSQQQPTSATAAGTTSTSANECHAAKAQPGPMQQPVQPSHAGSTSSRGEGSTSGASPKPAPLQTTGLVSSILHAAGQQLFYASTLAVLFLSAAEPVAAAAAAAVHAASLAPNRVVQAAHGQAAAHMPGMHPLPPMVLGMMDMGGRGMGAMPGGGAGEGPTASGAGAGAGAKGGTAAQRYSCTPYSDAERVYAFDLGGYTHRIATRSPSAQVLFDQGLLLAFDFNREEAVRAFEAALKLDPGAAMAHWGIAYALGPYLNNAAVQPAADPMDYPSFNQEQLRRGLGELQQAMALVEAQLAEAGPEGPRQAQLQQDREYIAALLPVFQTGDTWGPAFRQAQAAYVTALQGIAQAHPEDADAPVLAAEALFNLQPWDAWDAQTKAPRGKILQILDLLDQGLQRDPGHALALHLTVHGTEVLKPGRGASSAARGEPAADLLASSFQSFAHLTHMSAHNYNRIGRWHDGVEANARALDIDTKDASRCLMPYMPVHNMQTLLWGAGMDGERAVAEEYAAAFENFPARFGPSYMAGGLEHGMLPLVWTRFAQWEQLLARPSWEQALATDGVMLPPVVGDVNKAIYLFTRSLALAGDAVNGAAGTGSPSGPAIERVSSTVQELRAVVKGLPPDPQTRPGPGLGVWTAAYNVAGRQMLAMAEARLALLQGDPQRAEVHLREALTVESEEVYAEPSYFYQPARQCLGALLLQQGRVQEAAQEYRKDLAELPENLWSLVGLEKALDKLGPSDGAAAAELTQVRGSLSRALEVADKRMPLRSSCPALFE